MSDYNYIDLFHGIGGFALGAHWAGMKFKNHFCSDIEPYCQKLYKLRFPDSIQFSDITKIDTEDLKKYGDKWIITGGFPCQDISIAGKGAGITGARSGLWFEYWRIIRDLRPRIAIMENVGMLVHRGLREVLGSLAEIGYNAEWQDIRASDMGAPHRRERIWIMAYPRHLCGWNEKQGTIRKSKKDKLQFHKVAGSSKMGNFSNARLRRQTKHEEQTTGVEQLCKNVSNSERTGLHKRHESKERQATGYLWEQYKNWKIEPAVCRVVNGISNELDGYQGRLAIKSFDRVNRLRGLGNAIVPQIAQLLFEQIKDIL